MSTIGYGDISPHTSPERLIGMGLMCIGCAFFAWITGKITQLMTEKSSCEERFDNLKEDVDTFMSQRHLPAELQAKINDYYKVRFPNKKVFDEDSIIADIEAPALKKEIVHHLFRDVVEMVPLFKLTANETQREICFKLRSVYRMPGRVITVAGQKPDNMYMIRFGQVEIKSIGPTVRTATPGCIFGELAIMGLTPENKRIRTSIAVSVCELCELSKESFYDLIGSQGGFFGLIRRASQMHLLMLKKNFECAKLRLDSREDSEQDEHFYDAMTYCPWDAICAVLAEEQEAEAFRKRSSQFDPDKIMQLEKLTGKKMLLTSIRFQFNSLGVLRDAGPLDSAVIVVTWPGVPGLSLTSVHNETEMFSVTDLAKGDIDVHRGINLPIIFPHGIRIKDLPPFTITVLTQNETTLQAASPSKMRGKDVTLSADFANAPPEPVPDRSMLYPSSSPLLGKST
jgi:CRP-like cAMP-binding protein